MPSGWSSGLAPSSSTDYDADGRCSGPERTRILRPTAASPTPEGTNRPSGCQSPERGTDGRPPSRTQPVGFYTQEPNGLGSTHKKRDIPAHGTGIVQCRIVGVPERLNDDPLADPLLRRRDTDRFGTSTSIPYGNGRRPTRPTLATCRLVPSACARIVPCRQSIAPE
jgi:hypothetical protein